MLRIVLLSLIVAAPVLAAETSAPGGVPDWAAPSGVTAPAPTAHAGPGVPPPPPPPPPPVPLDGGLTLLALAGAGYAGKKLRDRRRQG